MSTGSQLKRSSAREWMVFFERTVYPFYRELYLKPLWEKHRLGKRPSQALALFLEGYAFERQGRDPSYAHAAADVITEHSHQLDQGMAKELEAKVWEDFSQLLNNENLNQRNNPLCVGENSLFETIKGSGGVNLVQFTKESMERGELQEAFCRIDTIRGVGPKITSFFLRDLKDVFEIDLSNSSAEGRDCLQPIDTWLRRTIQKLSNDGNKSDKNIARFVVKNSGNPERANMGIWFFSAVICGSQYRLKKSLLDITFAKSAVRDYFVQAKRVCNIDANNF